MKKFATLATSTALAFGTAVASAQTRPVSYKPLEPTAAAEQVTIETYAKMLQANTQKYCKPEFDGDKAKGQTTNADLGAQLKAIAKLPEQYTDLKPADVRQLLAKAVEDDVVICIDRRNAELGIANVPPTLRPKMALYKITSTLYPALSQIGVTPGNGTPESAVTPKHLLGSIAMLLTGSSILDQQLQAALLLNETGQVAKRNEMLERAIALSSTPHLYLTSSAGRVGVSPALNADHLIATPVATSPDSKKPAATPPVMPETHRPPQRRIPGLLNT